MKMSNKKIEREMKITEYDEQQTKRNKTKQRKRDKNYVLNGFVVPYLIFIFGHCLKRTITVKI